jgi:hypothetical protein
MKCGEKERVALPPAPRFKAIRRQIP